MKTLLISIAILFALSSTVYAHGGYEKGYNSHHSNKYAFNHGKHKTHSRHHSHYNHHFRKHVRNLHRGLHRQSGYRNYGGIYLKVPYYY